MITSVPEYKLWMKNLSLHRSIASIDHTLLIFAGIQVSERCCIEVLMQKLERTLCVRKLELREENANLDQFCLMREKVWTIFRLA